MKHIVLSKELLDYWLEHETKILDRRKFLSHLRLSIHSAKTYNQLTFQADCAYVWNDRKSDCTTMSWETFNKLSEKFNYIDIEHYTEWKSNNKQHIVFTNENRLQKQETHVVRGDDGERGSIQGRRGKASITIEHLSYKAIHS